MSIPIIDLKLEGDGAWPDLADKRVHQVSRQSGRPSVSIRIDLPDGSAVVAETSLRLLLTAVDAIVALRRPALTEGAHGRLC